ncbi:hypothetical protein DM02DRAFT_260177 [Periconia macrospinosa]|uniref:Uncharacterized protein n=1 Tax=Periconia macrospinosa TaxID=97972 RepID=A0A2V1D4A4_9PLEO|nr:hypothetical protein DM02DRAFT_260177 [Periconia macrospinosa]
MQNRVLADGQIPAKGNFTLSIDCDGFLMPDPNRPDIFKSKPAAEAALYFRLETLLTVPTIQQIKVKCFHVCGEVELDEGACLVTPWGIGDWFVDQYRQGGKSAYYEKGTRDSAEDWNDPDILLTVFIDQ